MVCGYAGHAPALPLHPQMRLGTLRWWYTCRKRSMATVLFKSLHTRAATACMVLLAHCGGHPPFGKPNADRAPAAWATLTSSTQRKTLFPSAAWTTTAPPCTAINHSSKQQHQPLPPQPGKTCGLHSTHTRISGVRAQPSPLHSTPLESSARTPGRLRRPIAAAAAHR